MAWRGPETWKELEQVSALSPEDRLWTAHRQQRGWRLGPSTSDLARGCGTAH